MAIEVNLRALYDRKICTVCLEGTQQGCATNTVAVNIRRYVYVSSVPGMVKFG